MPSNPDRPFDHDTLKLRAVFVPDDAKDQVSKADITGPLGYDAVKIPAVFVPEGGERPGYPYEPFGRAVFRADEDGSEERSFTTFPSSQSPDATEADDEPTANRPGTRYRFGAALARGRHLGPPPNPASAGGRGDALAAGIAALRGMAKPGTTLRRSLAAAAPGQGVITADAGPPTPQVSVGDQDCLDRYHDAVKKAGKEALRRSGVGSWSRRGVWVRDRGHLPEDR